LTRAFVVRAVIQQAIGVISATQRTSPELAYAALRLRAADAGAPLLDTAREVIAEHQ
jgi:AmiR/NasT family two-component response regulator